jgi:mRNA-degrading endonuclease RelE of RelBE toxin-antitoxin system
LFAALELEEEQSLEHLVSARMKKPGRTDTHAEAGRLPGLKSLPMSFEIEWREDALSDLKPLPGNIRERAWTAVKKRPGTAPARYGTRLRRSLIVLWNLRVGDLRVIDVINETRVTIRAVVDRRDVYPDVEHRTKGHTF